RGFTVGEGESFIVAEDVITRGGRVQETIDIVRAGGGRVAAVAVLVDRSGGTVDFGAPTFRLLEMTPQVWSPDQCPLCARGIPIEHPGSA
ncbi:MAG: orotate phosphoribosyltransferase, partial [Kiritimatiellae bacterium]|nr:orotate phosphoribosyltransferase [Kiritimatiellia bacterium]